MEMHRALGLARGPGSESDQGHVLRGRVRVREAARLPRSERFERIGRVVAPVHRGFQHRTRGQRGLQLGVQAPVAQGMRDPRLEDDLGQLFRPQKRHGRHRDSARLHHREPACGHPGTVRAAKEHAVARCEAHVLGEHPGDAVGLLEQLRIAELALRKAQGDAPAPAALDRSVEQLARAVQALGITQLRQLEEQLRPLPARRQIVAREGVDVRGAAHGPVCGPHAIPSAARAR